MNQGVRQGGITSTDDYKLYINDLLLKLENSGKGLKIGNIDVGNPTCADDLILLSDMSMLLDTSTEYANSHCYTLHPQKSMSMIYNVN